MGPPPMSDPRGVETADRHGGAASPGERGRKLLLTAAFSIVVGVGLLALSRVGPTGSHGGVFIAIWALPFLAFGAICAVFGFALRRAWSPHVTALWLVAFTTLLAWWFQWYGVTLLR